jgi:6-phosphogluconolactonase (cycloisomerase 2 family)
MMPLLKFHSRTGRAILACFILAISGTLVWVGRRANIQRDVRQSVTLPRKFVGEPRLVSAVPLPATEGPLCEWAPASATLSETFQSAATTSSDTGSRTAVDSDRAPLRIIRDTYPTYSAVTLDLTTNEVFLQDENLFGVKVFNRLDNTPPGASFTEPKRVLGGILTKLEFNCGLYIDPNSGDLYSINNDTVDTMTVFPRNAQGNVKPMRELETPHRTYGIAVDERDQELYLSVQHPPAVAVYRKAAQGEEKPIRILQGERTQLRDAHGIALDTKNNLLFISNHGAGSVGPPDDSVIDIKRRIPGSGKFEPPSITVYPLKASGDTPPLRVISGPKTQLDWPAAMAIDSERGELYVTNDAEDSILVFRATDNGDVAPARILKGPKTGLKYPTGIFLDSKNGEMWVSNMGNHSATVYSIGATGNAAPLRTIRSAPEGKLAQAIGNPGAVAYDSKREEILVPN